MVTSEDCLQCLSKLSGSGSRALHTPYNLDVPKIFYVLDHMHTESCQAAGSTFWQAVELGQFLELAFLNHPIVLDIHLKNKEYPI